MSAKACNWWRRVFAAAGGAAILFGIGLASAPLVAAAVEQQVAIHNFAFGPATIAAGTEVVWTNQDSSPHTVSSAEGPTSFKSGALDTGDKFAFTFDKAGTYKYFCTLHPQMIGTIVVK